MQIAGKRAQIQPFAPFVKKGILALSKKGIRTGGRYYNVAGLSGETKVRRIEPCSAQGG